MAVVPRIKCLLLDVTQQPPGHTFYTPLVGYVLAKSDTGAQNQPPEIEIESQLVGTIYKFAFSMLFLILSHNIKKKSQMLCEFGPISAQI